MVLKRIWESDTKKLETYYVYDDFGDLRFVIPPGFTAATITENDPTFNELIYAYKYDERRRLVEKKIPGKGWEYIVYNKNDQPVLAQDAVQRAENKWNYTKYDAFGRVTESGIYTNATVDQTTRIQIQNLANAATIFWEDRLQVANYTNNSFPTTNLTPLLINYYDDYTFEGANTATLQAVGITPSQKNKTLITGTKVFKDDGTSGLLSINYYDDRARLIQSASQNHLTGTDYVTNTYSFVGELLTSKREHKASASGAVTTLLTTNKYDHVGRLLDTRHKVNAQTEVILARNEYNEIGQLKNKKQHSEDDGTNFINTTTYSYNERGWTSKASSSHFTYELKYNTGTVPQFNGNISQQLWGHNATSTPNVYSYTYDKLNRLLTGTSTGTVMSEVLTYDDMGNIKTLTRDGTAISYNYISGGNRLNSVNIPNALDYTYDANGNAKTDRTGMTFTYNHLNLPKTATKSGTSVSYLYDATGAKLQKNAEVNGVTNVRNYIAGIEYNKVGAEAQAIEMIHTGEGYLQNSNGTYTYYYNLTDHLGNVRATLQRTSATTGTVIQKHDYYPFGKSRALAVSGINKYLYNGKEVQSELGDQQDYGARFYDPEIGRWNVPDPLAEQMRRHSPYNYAFNNPLRFIDPDGMAPRPGQHGMYYDFDEQRYRDEERNDVSFDQAMAYHQQGADQEDIPSSNSNSFWNAIAKSKVIGDPGAIVYDGNALFGTNFIGPGPDKNPFTLPFGPKDMIDDAALYHDYSYFLLKASGVKGAFTQLNVQTADRKLAQDALNVINGYYLGQIDPITKKRISSYTYNVAVLVYSLFTPIHVTKGAVNEANSQVNQFHNQLLFYIMNNSSR